MEKITKENPDLDINYRLEDPDGTGDPLLGPALVDACSFERLDVVSFLLKQPAIDVNRTCPGGRTALMMACHKGNLECVRLLMQHPIRVEMRGFVSGETAIEIAVSRGWKDILRWWIAAGHEIDTRRLYVGRGGSEADQLEMESMLRDFEKDPDFVRQQLSVEFKLPAGAAYLFALVVFATDGYLSAPATLSIQDPFYRFLQMVEKLPMELQMIVCLRWLGSMRTGITSKHVNIAFKILAKRYQPLAVPVTPSSSGPKVEVIAQQVDHEVGKDPDPDFFLQYLDFD